jgi:hypothetical protein
MAASVDSFDFALTASNTSRQQINTFASFVRYTTGSAGGLDSQIEIWSTDGSGKIKLYPGQKFTFEQQYANWVIRNVKGQAPITGELIFGDGSFEDSNISGSVNVIDNSKSRTLSGLSFSVSNGISALATKYATGQLWNPAGSGKNIMVEGFTASSTGNIIVSAGWNTAVLANFVRNNKSKKSGGADGVGQVYYESLAGSPTGLTANFSANIQANSQLIINFKEPVVITPGFGFCVQSSTVSGDLAVNIESYEEPV